MVNQIFHYGTPRHSGRYPWGSGEDPEQRNRSFMGEVKKLKDKGLSEKEIAEGMGMSIAQLRARKSIAKDEIRKSDQAQAWRLKQKGYSDTEIGRLMNRNESSIRSLLNPAIKERSEITNTTANVLKDRVDEKNYIDIGVGSERFLGISRTKLKTAVEKLKDEEGYTVHYVTVEQLGTGKNTSVMVLAKPGVQYPEVYKNKYNISMIKDCYSEDGGRSFLGVEPPKNVDSKRIMIRYTEDGGSNRDGVIELRRGVDDISLGKAKYAQVRVAVDGTHYMKGMAMYGEDIPDGYDMVYNTNKSKSVPKEKVFKKMKEDKDNPFGAVIRQKHYVDKNGKEQLSALNIVGSKEGSGEEGSWDTWSKNLSSQMLSKQSPALAKKQLGFVYDDKKSEYDEIISLTNPAVKKKLLESFADDCDSSAVHLKAAGLPRQASRVILPLPKLKENEIYAPTYRNGERVALIRYPHGGTFEIPELIVNNMDKSGKNLLGEVKDAVGINPKVAERLSGADFDGDSVLVIPNNNRAIQTSAPLKGLIDFDPKLSYKLPEDAPQMSSRTKQMKMGDVSNLITDMTIKGAPPDHIARAVRHSMVVIDAEKHHLDYKQSYIDNGIGALKKKYQGSERSGASTLISRASSEKRVYDRKEGVKVLNPDTGKERVMYIDPATGKKLYSETGKTYLKRTVKIEDPITGKKKWVSAYSPSGKKEIANNPNAVVKEKELPKTVKTTKMAEVDDAFKLSSGTLMETIYADHANKLKDLANEARKEAYNSDHIIWSESAKKAYEPEVSSLKAKLNIALKNAPLERQAQLLANSIVATKKADNPSMTAEDIKKIRGQAMAEARSRTGAKKQPVEITEKEWEAIQAGAISGNVLKQIIDNTDLDRLKQLATPRTSTTMSEAKQKRAKAMLASGRTQAEVADALGVSTRSISNLVE